MTVQCLSRYSMKTIEIDLTLTGFKQKYHNRMTIRSDHSVHCYLIEEFLCNYYNCCLIIQYKYELISLYCLKYLDFRHFLESFNQIKNPYPFFLLELQFLFPLITLFWHKILNNNKVVSNDFPIHLILVFLLHPAWRPINCNYTGNIVRDCALFQVKNKGSRPGFLRTYNDRNGKRKATRADSI